MRSWGTISLVLFVFVIGFASTYSCGGGSPATPKGDATEEKAEYDVILIDIGSEKIKVIKAVRALTGLGLKDANDLVEGAPGNIMDGVSKEKAEEARIRLEDAGAKVEIR